MKKNIIIISQFFFTVFLFWQEQFTEQPSISLPGVGNSSVARGDYDHDGDLDILLTGYTGYPTAARSEIYRNNGNNTFSKQTSIYLTGVDYSSVAWGD